LIFIDKPDFAMRKAMGRFSWDAEEVLNITKYLAGLGHKVEDRLSDRRIVPAGEGIVHHVWPLVG
jgi:hypothetical protein